MLSLVYLSLIEEQGNIEVAVKEHIRGVYRVCDSKIKGNLWEGEFSSSTNSALLIGYTLTKEKE